MVQKENVNTLVTSIREKYEKYCQLHAEVAQMVLTIPEAVRNTLNIKEMPKPPGMGKTISSITSSNMVDKKEVLLLIERNVNALIDVEEKRRKVLHPLVQAVKGVDGATELINKIKENAVNAAEATREFFDNFPENVENLRERIKKSSIGEHLSNLQELLSKLTEKKR